MHNVSWKSKLNYSENDHFPIKCIVHWYCWVPKFDFSAETQKIHRVFLLPQFQYHADFQKMKKKKNAEIHFTSPYLEFFLHNFFRVMMDVMSVMGNSGIHWENKTDLAFWRGRDSRQERLNLVVMSRKYPEIIDAAMTHMFFFPKDVEKYGELVDSISFFDFFKVSCFYCTGW